MSNAQSPAAIAPLAEPIARRLRAAAAPEGLRPGHARMRHAREGSLSLRSLSFGESLDPSRMAIGPLRALNEEILEPGAALPELSLAGPELLLLAWFLPHAPTPASAQILAVPPREGELCFAGPLPGALPLGAASCASILRCPSGSRVHLPPAPGRLMLLMQLQGEARCADARLSPGDSLEMARAGPIDFAAVGSAAEALLLDLPSF